MAVILSPEQPSSLAPVSARMTSSCAALRRLAPSAKLCSTQSIACNSTAVGTHTYHTQHCEQLGLQPKERGWHKVHRAELHSARLSAVQPDKVIWVTTLEGTGQPRPSALFCPHTCAVSGPNANQHVHAARYMPPCMCGHCHTCSDLQGKRSVLLADSSHPTAHQMHMHGIGTPMYAYAHACTSWWLITSHSPSHASRRKGALRALSVRCITSGAAVTACCSAGRAALVWEQQEQRSKDRVW